MAHLPMKTYTFFLFITQTQKLFQSCLLWVEKLSDSPSWYILAQQMPDREHLSHLPEKKISENFCLHSFPSLLHFSNPIFKKPSENTKTLQIQSYLSQSRTFSHFSSALMCLVLSNSH